MRTPETLSALVDHGIIDEVLRPLMSGKEAHIYLVESGGEQRVAKIYKEAQNRSFQNRADYTEGRKVRNSRDQRAMGSRSKHGRAQNEAAWKSAEVDMIYRLREAGVRVPVPHHFIDGVLIMELVTDAEGFPAPRLGDLTLEPEEATEVFHKVLAEVVRMLCAGVVHGDLSDFNVLMSADGPVVIDFPQAVDASSNANARKLLLRDVDNLHRFHAKFAPNVPALPYAQEMWDLYSRNALTPDARLTGKFRTRQSAVSTESVLDLIADADKDERRRREGLGLSMRGTNALAAGRDFGRGPDPRLSGAQTGQRGGREGFQAGRERPIAPSAQAGAQRNDAARGEAPRGDRFEQRGNFAPPQRQEPRVERASPRGSFAPPQGHEPRNERPAQRERFAPAQGHEPRNERPAQRERFAPPQGREPRNERPAQREYVAQDARREQPAQRDSFAPQPRNERPVQRDHAGARQTQEPRNERPAHREGFVPARTEQPRGERPAQRGNERGAPRQDFQQRDSVPTAHSRRAPAPRGERNQATSREPPTTGWGHREDRRVADVTEPSRGNAHAGSRERAGSLGAEHRSARGSDREREQPWRNARAERTPADGGQRPVPQQDGPLTNDTPRDDRFSRSRDRK